MEWQSGLHTHTEGKETERKGERGVWKMIAGIRRLI